MTTVDRLTRIPAIPFGSNLKSTLLESVRGDHQVSDQVSIGQPMSSCRIAAPRLGASGKRLDGWKGVGAWTGLAAAAGATFGIMMIPVALMGYSPPQTLANYLTLVLASSAAFAGIGLMAGLGGLDNPPR